MDAGLRYEGAPPHIRCMPVGGAVEHLVQGMGGVREHTQLPVRDCDVKALGELGFELERRYDRDKVCVAAALAQPIERSLHLTRSGAHCRQRIRDCVLGIVMSMDSDMVAGNALTHLADDLFHLVRQSTAICVA